MTARRLLLLLAAGCVAAALGEEEAIQVLVLSGACDVQNDLNGLVFIHQGATESGAPYYRARVDGGEDQYLYWDPDCSDSGDAEPRWVIDNSRPSEGLVRDLDGDDRCDYHARSISEVYSHPPYATTWRMNCGTRAEPVWQDTFLSLMGVTLTTTSTTVTTTSTTATTTSTTISTTTRTATATTRTVTTTTGTTTTTTFTSSSTSTTVTTTVTTAPPTTTLLPTTSASLLATSTSAASATETTSEAAAPTSTTGEAPETTSTPQPVGATTTAAGDGNLTTQTTIASEAAAKVVAFRLTGACESYSFLNGLTFRVFGVGQTGRPAYKATGAAGGMPPQYIYYDPACAGEGSSAGPRWILDAGDEPDLSRASDLDNDQRCYYHARLSDESEEVPLNGVWQMFCSGAWADTMLLMDEVVRGDLEQAIADLEEEVPQALVVGGACAAKDYLNGMVFSLRGRTASGAPFYGSDSGLYVFYDPDCAGDLDVDKPGRWVIDNQAPNVTLASDLDQDGRCNYHARVDSGDTSRPPALATWTMYCNGTWSLHNVTLSAQVPVSTTAASPTPGTISSAEPLQRCGPAWVLPFIVALLR